MKKEYLESRNAQLRVTRARTKEDQERSKQDCEREQELKALRRTQVGGAGAREEAEQSARQAEEESAALKAAAALAPSAQADPESNCASLKPGSITPSWPALSDKEVR